MVTRVGGKWTFRITCPQARRVYLVGDFNGWSTTAIAMDPLGRGIWQVSISLPPGTYRFRYFADGQWLNDYAAFGLAPNGMGQWDSVLYVPSDDPVIENGQLLAPATAAE
jgi:1,4-alpha-glucan branching enzyme